MGVRVRKHKGTYYVFVNLAGRRKAHKIGPDKRMANSVASAIRKKMARGEYVITPAGTPASFADLARAWLERYPLTEGLRPNTLQNHALMVKKYLIPYFGAMQVSEITPRLIEDFIVAKQAPGGSVKFKGRGLAPQTLRVGLVTLRLILRRAVRDGLIAVNPAAEVRVARRREGAGPDPFTPAELRAIIGAAEDLYPDLALMLELWARCGTRAGEVAGLQTHDVDPAAGTALIRRTFSRRRVGPPKVASADRRVYITHPTLEDSPEWRPGATAGAHAFLDRLRQRRVVTMEPDAFVFRGARGQPYTSANLHKPWQRILLAAKVRYREPEQLRHTWASILLSRNAPLLYMQQAGGWASANVLLRVYAKWLPSQIGFEGVAMQTPATQAQPSRGVVNEAG